MRPSGRRFGLLLLLFAVAVLPAAAEYFVIDHYAIEMDVLENNSYRIDETIDVIFSQERHGIYRDIPLTFNGRPVKIRDIKVRGFDSKISRSGDELSIRIGDADIWVDGRQTYRISYLLDVGADDLPDMDEFYHNLIGLWWETDIQRASFVITMPKPFDASKLNFTSGDAGSTDSSGVDWDVDGRRISGQITRPLGPYQGLTASLPLPEGYWVGAKVHKEPGWLVFTIFGYPLFILTLAASFILWYRFGRDNKLFPSVEFEPPDGLNPSEIGYVIDGSVDNKDVTSLIIYWAQQGCLDIEEEVVERKIGRDRKVLSLVKNSELPESSLDYEHRMFKKLFSFGDGTRVSLDDLEDRFYSTVSKTKERIKKSFTDHPDRAIYRKGGGLWTFLAGLFAALPIMLVMVQGFTGFTGSFAMGLMGLPFSMFLVIPSLMLGSAVIARGEGAKGKIIFSLLFGGFSFLFFAMAFVFVTGSVPLLKYLAAVASGIGSGVFVSIMRRRTEYGDRILERTLGFREFIKEAETDKLEALFETNPSYFYDILPYAMVLGLTDRWASHFESLAVESPRWYRGYDRNRFNSVVFASAMSDSFRSINTTMNSSPSSSSSGGSSSGGFSGGGSGGGGGSSW